MINSRRRIAFIPLLFLNCRNAPYCFVTTTGLPGLLRAPVLRRRPAADLQPRGLQAVHQPRVRRIGEEPPGQQPSAACDVASVVTRTKYFSHQGRVLEVRDRRVMTSFQIWIYEDDRPVSLHSVMRLVDVSAGLTRGVDLLNRAMADAVADVLQGRFLLGEPPSMTAAE